MHMYSSKHASGTVGHPGTLLWLLWLWTSFFSYFTFCFSPIRYIKECDFGCNMTVLRMNNGDWLFYLEGQTYSAIVRVALIVIYECTIFINYSLAPYDVNHIVNTNVGTIKHNVWTTLVAVLISLTDHMINLFVSLDYTALYLFDSLKKLKK